MATPITTFIAALTTLQTKGPVYEQMRLLADGVHEEYPITAYMNSHGKYAMDGGGSQISWNITNATQLASGYYGGSQLVTSTVENTVGLTLPKAYVNLQVAYHLTDILQNRGEGKIRNYISDQIDEAKENFALTLELMVLGDSWTDGNGNDISAYPSIAGLQLLVQDHPTTSANTYAGKVRSSTTTWLNGNAISLTGVGSISTTFLNQMMRLCSHNKKSPDLIVTNDTAFNTIWNLAKAEKWPSGNEGPASKKAYDLGFPEHIIFRGATIIPSKAMTSTANGGILTTELGKLYFLNTKDGLNWGVDPDDNATIGKQIEMIDQNSFVQKMHGTYQLLGPSPRLNGVINYTV